MTALLIRLTRLSNTHHRFEAIGANGEAEVRELETRSFLLHDLAHFALESEARLEGGFYGMLARGGDYGASMLAGEALAIEQIVGALQGACKGETAAAAFVQSLRAYMAQIGEEAPAWLTEELIERLARRLRRLLGQWRATPFGETMELTFRLN